MKASDSTSAPAGRVLAVLWVVYVFNFVDRNILSILLEPIRQELGVSDTAMGVLTGFAFAVFYTFAGIPIARLSDRASRRVVMAVGVAFWSLATAGRLPFPARGAERPGGRAPPDPSRGAVLILRTAPVARGN